jgi:hypothetical protein
MSDLTPHSRDDLVELPSDCEPPHGDPHLATDCPECENGRRCSPALCTRRQALHRGQLRARLEASVRLLQGDGRVVDLAAERVARRVR